MDAVAELDTLNADRERLLRDGLAGVATIVGIRRNVAATTLESWHELELMCNCQNVIRTAQRGASRSSCRRRRISRSAPRCRRGWIPGTRRKSSWSRRCDYQTRTQSTSI